MTRKGRGCGVNDSFPNLPSGRNWEWLLGITDSLTAIILFFAAVIGGIWKLWVFLKNRKQANAFEVQSLVMAAPSHSVKELDDCYYAELHKRCDRYDLGSFRDS